MDDQLATADLDRYAPLGSIPADGNGRTVTMLDDPAGTAVTAWARAWHSDRSPVSRSQQTGDSIHLLADVLAPRADARGQARQLLKRWPKSRQRSHGCPSRAAG
jgi:hypothetical protein